VKSQVITGKSQVKCRVFQVKSQVKSQVLYDKSQVKSQVATHIKLFAMFGASIHELCDANLRNLDHPTYYYYIPPSTIPKKKVFFRVHYLLLFLNYMSIKDT